MRFFYTIILWIFCVFFGTGIARESCAQALDSVLFEAPIPLGDVRSIRREPDQETFKPVDERLPPELRPVSIRWKGLEIFPLLELSQSYDSNMFVTQSNEESDFITIIKPSVFFKKEVGRHNFSWLIEADAKQYLENSEESNENFNTRLNGVIEMRREISFPFEVSYTLGHEGRAQNFSTNFATKPLEFKSFGTAFGISYDPNRLGLGLVGRYTNIEFDNGVNSAGTAVIRSDSDRSIVEIEARGSYDILPNHKPFVSLTYTDTNYKRNDFENGSFSGPQRDSKSIGFLAGWELVYKGLIEGYLGVGYGSRNYKNASIRDVKSSRVAGSINWNISKKATLNLGLRRQISEDNDVIAGAILSQAHIELDYEFLHNLFFDIFVDKALIDFQETFREDNILSLGSGLRYHINPRHSLSGHYNFKTRDSNSSGLDYDRHQLMLRFNTRL